MADIDSGISLPISSAGVVMRPTRTIVLLRYVAYGGPSVTSIEGKSWQ